MLRRLKETKKIKKLLNRIEVTKGVIEALPLRPHIEENLRKESLLKSAVFSAICCARRKKKRGLKKSASG